MRHISIYITPCLLIHIFILNVHPIQCQSFLNLKGVVVDNSTKLPLAFASVVCDIHSGTTTDSMGKFSLHIPISDSIYKSSISFSYIGYKEQKVAVADIKNHSVQVSLDPMPYNLQEYTAKPLSAWEYIQFSLQSIDENYNAKPFHLLVYMQNNVYENENIVSCLESVYKTFYHDKYLTDPIHGSFENENQILLFRKKENLPTWTFMRKEVNEINKKKKYVDDENPLENDTLIQIGLVPLIVPIYTSNFPFFDSSKFHLFSYTIQEGNKTSPFIVINVTPKKKSSSFKYLDFRGNATIYIDRKTSAIVKLNFKGDFTIPFLIRTFIWLKFKKLKIKNIYVQGSIEFQQNSNDKYWYPYTTQFWATSHLEKTNWFKKNDKADIAFTSTYLVNKIWSDQSSPITQEKKYSYKRLNLQNDMNIKWEDINKRSIDRY